MPTIYQAREREATAIPIDEVLREGQIDIIPEVQGHEYFGITFRGDRLTITAGKYVGLVPLNDRVFIHVEPKVPVRNLLAMLSAVEGDIVELSVLDREYRATPTEPPKHILAAIASAFATTLTRIEIAGLEKVYEPFTNEGSLLKGQLRFAESLQRYWSRGTRYAAVSSFYDLTADIPYNRLLRYAVHVLLVHHQRAEILPGTVRLLGHFEELFSRAGVRLDQTARLGVRVTPGLSPEYSRALRLAKLIVAGHGIELQGQGEGVSLPSFLIDMERLFEDYMRHVFATHVTGAEVLNGNREGAKPIFDDRREPRATPDIVCRQGKAWPLIGEVKYKTNESKDDRYQVMAYALSYRAKDIVLILPTDGVESSGLTKVGEVNAVNIHRYRFDLAATDLEAEATAMAAVIDGLVQTKAEAISA